MSDRLDREFRYILRQCPKLNDAEIRFLAFLGCFRHGCLLNYDQICQRTNWSIGKLKRTISSLKKHALIEITYRCYKKTTIKIVPASQQVAFVRANDSSLVSHELCLTGGLVIAHPRTHDSSLVSHSIIERELERKLESDLNYKTEQGGEVPRKPGDAMRLVRELTRTKGII